ncbi:hypothetical protein DFJ74DRAFT_62536 [Hyaloraphidium curvatum]|nr:hypothetical protein DFJ74DRAFT_62536 [Hyaloraphidium curvatum]
MPPKKSTKSRGKQPAAPPATPAQGPAAAGAAGAPGVPTTPAPAPAPPVAPHGDAPTGSAHLPAQPGTGGPQINVIPAFVPDPTRLAHPQLTEALAEANRRSIDEYKSFLSTSVKDALKTKFARAAFQAVGPLDVLYRWLRSVPNPRGAFLDFVDNLEAARLLDSDDLKGAKGLKELMEKDPKDPLHTKFTKKVFQAAIARQMNVQAAPAPAATAQAGPAAAEPQREVAASVVTRPLAALKPLTDKDAKSLFGESAPTFLEPAVDAAKQRSVRVPIATAFFKWAARGASIPSVEGASGPTWSEFREVMEERRRTWSEAGMTFGEGLYHRFLDAMRAEGFDAKSGHLDELRRFLTIAKDEGTGRDKTKSEFEFLLENEELESGVTITSGFVRKLNDLLQDDGSAGAQVGQEQTLPLAKTISDLIESVVSNDDGVRTDLIFCLDFAYSKDLTTLLEHFQRERIEGIRKRVVSSTRNGKVRPAVLERLKEGSQVDRHLRRYIKQHATAAAQSTTRRERGTRRQAVGFQVRESHAYFRLAPGTSSIQTHESRKSDRELQVAEGRRTSRRQPEPRAVHSAMSSAPGSRGHSPKRRRVASGGPEYLVTDDGSSPGRMLMEAEQTAQPARPDSGLLEQAERRFRREGAAVENDLNYNAPAAPPGHVLVLTPADLLERGFGVRDPALIKDYRTNLAAWRFLERSGGTTSRRPTKKEPSWTVSEDFDERFQMQMLYGSKDSFAHGILRLAVPRFATPEDKEKKEAEVAASWTTGCEAEVMEACGKPWEDLKQGTREWMKALEIKRRFKKLKDKALKELIDEDAKFRRRVLFEFRADSRRTAVPRDKRRASAGRAPAAPPPPDPAPLQRKRGRAPAPPPAAAPQAPSTAALSPPPVPPVDPRRPAAPVHNSNATPVVQPEPTGYGDFQSLHQLFFACDRALEHAIQEGPAADRAALEEERKALGTAVDLLRMRVPARAFHSLSVFADVCSRPVDTQEQVFNVCSVGGRALDAVLRAFNLLKFQPGVNFGNRVVLDESSICAYCDGPIKEVVAACKHHSPANLEMIKARHMAGHFSAYANKDAPQQVVDFPSLLRQIAERDGLQAVESFVLRNHAQNGIGCGSLGKVVPALWSGKHFIDGVRNALEIGATWIDPFWRQLIESDPRAVPSPPGSSSAAPSHPPARAAPPSTPAPKPHPSTNAPPLTKEAAALPPRPSCVVCGGAPGKCKSDCDPQLRAYFDQIADAWDPERKRHFRVSTEFLTRPAKNLISSLLPHIRALLQRAIADHSFQRRLRQELPGFIHLGLDMWLKENEHGSFVVDDASMYYLARLRKWFPPRHDSSDVLAVGTRNSEREPFKPNTADKGLDAARVRVTEFFRRKVLPRFLKLIKETELMGSFWGADVVDSTGQSISSQILVSYCNQLKSIDRPLGKLIRGRFVDAGMPSGLVGRLAQRALAVLFDNVPAELMVGTDFIEAIAAPSDAAGDASTDDKDSDEANLAAELEQVKEEDGVGKDDGHKAGEREQKLFQTVLRECLDIMRLLPQDSRDLLGHLHSEKRFPPRPELGWELWRRKESEKASFDDVWSS